MRTHLDVDTQLADLDGCTVDDIREMDQESLARSVEIILQQVGRPRANLGGGGPPGRAD
jgi:hypothetical protein